MVEALAVWRSFLQYFSRLILGWCALTFAQESGPPKFEAKVDLVLVPVVVRDRHGRATGNLTKEDFRLYDNGKPQTITSFSVVERAKVVRPNPGTDSPAAGSEVAGVSSDKGVPERYFVYVFDDVNIRFADMANVRAAAVSHFKTNFAAGDHAAIDTLSGKHSLEFTSDRESLQDAVSKLRWGQLAGRGGMECPDVSTYIAHLVIDQADPLALEGLTNHTAECAHVRPELAKQVAMAAANRRLMLGAEDSRLALATLKRAIRRLSAMPGQRVIVLASPGFFAQTTEAIKATAEVLELAARNDVVINGLSVRGIIMAEEEEDVTRKVGVSRRTPPSASSPEQLWVRYRRESARADGDVMNDLAQGTGGEFFHNNNGLRAGFEQLAKAPEFSYVLGFSPSDFKADASFHSLKVQVQNAKVEARRGYYALRPDPAGQVSTAELEDAIFSRQERTDIPVFLQTGYSKAIGAAVVKVLLVAKIDTTRWRRGSFDAAITLFDQEGGYAAGTAEKVTSTQEDADVTLRWEFPEIKPGSYVVRLVIREPISKAMTAINRPLLVR